MSRPGRWPLFLIAAPAAVAIWSGWVGLGGLCGFGPVNLAPGIGGGFTINTAITLPVGVEAYAAYALRWWMDPAAPSGARGFAKWSALGALAYGMLGQVVYHLLAAAHVSAAPWPVVVLVSCMPVTVLGFAAALTHKLRASKAPAEDVAGEHSLPTTGALPGHSTRSVPSTVFEAAEASMAATAAAGNPLSRNQLQDRFGLSRRDATEVWAPYQIPKKTTAPVMTAPGGETPPAPPGAHGVPAGAATERATPAGAHLNGQVRGGE